MLPMAFMAPWRSGYAADCKSVYPGSIPGGASNSYVLGCEPPVSFWEMYIAQSLRAVLNRPYRLLL